MLGVSFFRHKLHFSSWAFVQARTSSGNLGIWISDNVLQ